MLVDARDIFFLNMNSMWAKHVESSMSHWSPMLKWTTTSQSSFNLKEKLDKKLTQLKDADMIREMGKDDEMGSLFVNPIFFMPKNDYVKLVIDARYLKSVKDLINYSWSLEPVQMILTTVSGKIFSVSDHSCAYHQVPLSSETQS